MVSNNEISQFIQLIENQIEKNGGFSELNCTVKISFRVLGKLFDYVTILEIVRIINRERKETLIEVINEDFCRLKKRIEREKNSKKYLNPTLWQDRERELLQTLHLGGFGTTPKFSAIQDEMEDNCVLRILVGIGEDPVRVLKRTAKKLEKKGLRS